MKPAEQARMRELAALEEQRRARAQKKPHKFEEAHDDPAPATHCWDCGLPRGHQVHRRWRRP